MLKPSRAQAQENVVSLLEEMLERDKIPPLRLLLTLCPDEPLVAVEPYDGSGARRRLIETESGVFVVVDRKWRQPDLELAKRFPGLQLDYWYREARKGNDPACGRLSGWIREFLTTARMHWSRAVVAYANGWGGPDGPDAGCTNLQFEPWLAVYLEQDGGYRGCGALWERARQIVRLACGLSRFAPTKPGRTG